MGFTSGMVAFQRFRIAGKSLGSVDDDFLRAVNDYGFGKRGSADPYTQVGWIPAGALFDPELTAEKVAFGRFAYLGLRIDKLNPPANIVRSYVQMEEDVALRASGREFLTKGERRQARETAKERAEQEARSGMFRRIASYPLLIDLERNELLFGNLGATVAEKLLELFGSTFQRGLDPVQPDPLAETLMREESRALEQLTPFHLVESPFEGDGDGSSLDHVDLNYLGKEFLTWLWFKLDAERSSLTLTDGNELTVMIDRTLRLECDFGMTGTDVITSDAPAGLPEAKAALAIGKQPTKMGLVIGSTLGDFSLVLDGRKWTVSGLILPEDDEDRSAAEAFEQRFELIFDCAHLLEVIFELFLRNRVARDWAGELRSMSAWARGGSKGAVRLRA